jgi:hypothetical protein
MRIVKAPNKKVGDKIYYKHIISSVPSEAIKKSGLLGKKLKVTAEKGKLIIEKE